MRGMRRQQQHHHRGARCVPMCASRSTRADAETEIGAALSRRRAAGMFLTSILIAGTPAVADEFESAIIDGSAPMSQLDEYESLLEMAGEKPQVAVEEEVRKFVPSEGRPKGEEKPQTEAEKMRAMVSTPSTTKARSSPAEKKKEKTSGSGGIPLPAVFAVAAAGIGGTLLGSPLLQSSSSFSR